jgi:hypothetical protein
MEMVSRMPQTIVSLYRMLTKQMPIGLDLGIPVS